MQRATRWIFATLLVVHGPAAAASAARDAYEIERAQIEAVRKALGMTAESTIFAHDFDTDAEPITHRTCADPLADRDADRLPDCSETGDGRHLGPHETGTSPDNPDTDGDGLLDGDEVLGTAAGLDLPALGVHPLRRDILLEYDWFDLEADCGFVSHRPTAEALARVTTMFANAPVRNPDGTTGIRVIHDYGQGGPYTGGNLVTGHDANLPGTFDATHAAIKLENFDARRRGYFHYVVMAHRYNGTSSSSGYAETIGDDLLVTLQCSRSVAISANTIAHELGHNLGLRHGGFEACNRKPNYNSIMNYRYQFMGVDSTCDATLVAGVADFSRGDRPPLDESALDEAAGVCGTGPVDWNRDGTIANPLSLDLNPQHVAICGGALTVLEDHDDWGNITFAGLLDAHGVLPKRSAEEECPPPPDAKRVAG